MASPCERCVLPVIQHESATTFFAKLLDTSDFPARWQCGTWSAELGWLHIISDLAIFAAYTAIPCLLIGFVLRRNVPFKKLFWLFGLFILMCGVGHLVEATIFWNPVYRLAGLVKAITALTGWTAVYAAWRTIPLAMRLPGIAVLNANLQREIEERKRVEEELLEQQSLLKNIISASPHAIFWKDRNSVYLGCNPVFARASGKRTPEEVIGLTDYDLETSRSEADHYREYDRRVIETGLALLNHEEPITINGKPHRLMTSKVPLRNADKEVIGVLGIFTDITHRQKAEEEIRKLSLVASKTRHSVIIADAHGRIEWVNNGFTALTGYSSAEAIGRRPGELLQGPDTDPVTVQEIRERLQRRESIATEIFNYDTSGRGYWILLEIEPVFDESGELTHFIATQTDITERKSHVEALRRAKEEAEQANQAKSQFLANMSHEIRTPLNGILGFAEVLRHGTETPDERNEYLRTIQSSGQHLLTLIDDVLDLAKIEAGRLEFERVPCSPHQVIRDVLSILRARAGEKGLTLECHWTSGVPETITTDPHRLRQLLMNLIGNAIKFTERGGVRIVAAVDAQLSEPRFHIEVHDTGVGIAPEHLEHIFQPFDQADASITRKFGGTGLGLAICRHIVEGLGGELTVQSELNRGSVFRATVATGPLEGVPLLAAPPAEAVAPTVSATLQRNELAGSRILLVEDGETNRKLISLVLRRAGADVTCAENGREGVEAAFGGAFDLILMDMQMPVMDGYTAARRLRSAGQIVPIIALTAHAMRGDEERCLEAGCTAYLSKPVESKRLLQTVADLLLDAPLAATAELDPCESTDGDDLERLVSTLPMDDPDFREIIAEFALKLPKQMAEMHEAWGQRDWDSLGRLAHWLKGAGGTVGFDEFTEPSTQLESAVRSRQPLAVEACIRQLDALAERMPLIGEMV